MDEKIKRPEKVGAAVVVGGGIGGMQAALDLAEAGIKVYLVEKSPAIGGRMVQLDKTFPTNECAMCVVSPKLVECSRHLNIEIITNAEVEAVSGEAGRFEITLHKKPRYILADKCTACGACVANCPVRYKINVIPKEKMTAAVPSEYEKSVADKAISENKDKKGSLMLILQAINASMNYFSEEVLKYISFQLDMPISTILRVATFYNSFSLIPRGRHIISVCMGTTCYVKGSEKLLGELAGILDVAAEETTRDRRFTLKAVRCLGCCSLAPAVMIDDKVYGHVRPKEIQKILADYK